MMARQCQGHNKEGAPCLATPQRARPWCVWHDPELAEQRQAWSVRGGANKSNRQRARKRFADEAMTLQDVDGLLGMALRQVASGTMEPHIGTALATIARAMTAVKQAGEIEERVRALEEQAGLHEHHVSTFPRRTA